MLRLTLFLFAAAASAAYLPLQTSARRGAAPARGARAPEMSAGKRKIVVTGIGVVSALGSKESFWESIVAGKSGLDQITAFDASKFPTTIGAEVKDFDPKPYFASPKTVKSVDRYTHLAVAASKMAVEDASLDLEKTDLSRMGVIVGSAFGGMDTFEKQTLNLDRGKKISPFTIPALLGNTASGIIGIEIGAQGPNFGVASACAAGSHAIGESLRFLQNGECDMMITGGAEAAITPLSFGGFCAMKAMCSSYNDTPQQASRPFDANRAGFVMGEGAGVLMLETEEHALARGAQIYCELAGYAATCDAHHITTPHPEGRGLATCLANALADADVPPSDVAYINAHGTSTAYNDKFETMAIKKVLGELDSNMRPAHVHPQCIHVHSHPLMRAASRANDAGLRRARAQARHLVDQVDDGAHARRGGRHRGVHSGQGDADGHRAADDQLRDARPRVRPQLRPQQGADARGAQGGHLRQSRLRRPQCGPRLQGVRQVSRASSVSGGRRRQAAAGSGIAHDWTTHTGRVGANWSWLGDVASLLAYCEP